MPNAMEAPRGDATGFTKYIKHDLLSGFLVFLIALPLCLGISLASGFPAIAGIFTAIIGSLVATVISNSELTIKGPAAGLIVILIGCVQDFGGNGSIGGFTAADISAYRMALAVGVVAALLQIVFGFFRAGILGEFFPVSTVHGMLAAIGVIIIAKQFPVALGVTASGEPLELLLEIPHFVRAANPAIAAIGMTSLFIMFVWPTVRRWWKPLAVLPAPLVVLLVAVPMGMGFDLMHEHSYTLRDHEYQLGEQYLVTMPDRMFGMFDQIAFPDFSALALPIAWKWVFMFFAIGSLESVLSAKAVDLIDPWKRKSSMDRDIMAVGAGNLLASLVGGLPMISEIVRSKANIDNGARTRFANFWHGIFLLACVALIPTVLHRIPLAALAAMLVYTGYRLAHPSEFVHVYHIGRAQLVIFVTTLIAVLLTDLLIGIGIGITVKIVLHLVNGVPLQSLFKTYLDVEPRGDGTCVVRARQSAVFSNWISFRRQLEDVGLVQRQNVILDLSGTHLVDHTVMGKLYQLQDDFEREDLRLEITGLDWHRPATEHEQAARKRIPWRFQRLTLVVDPACEEHVAAAFLKFGALGYTAFPCSSGGRCQREDGHEPTVWSAVRMEVIAPQAVCTEIYNYVRDQVLDGRGVTAWLDWVEVLQRDAFVVPASEQPLPETAMASANGMASTNGNVLSS